MNNCLLVGLEGGGEMFRYCVYLLLFMCRLPVGRLWGLNLKVNLILHQQFSGDTFLFI